MNPQHRDYIVIIVHHGEDAVTEQTLARLKQCEQPPNIVVVNHNAAPFQTTQSAVAVLNPPNNAGYAAGINRGLGYLAVNGVQPSDIIVSMNNDVEVPLDMFVKLRRYYQHTDSVAFHAPMVREDGQRAPGAGDVRLLSGRARLRTTLTNSTPLVASTTLHLSYLHGACLIAPYQTYMAVGSLPDHYFMYWEDPLLSVRAQRKKIPLKILDTITVRHLQHKTAAQQDDELYYLVRNGAHFLEHETPSHWPHYWYIINRLRLLYHTAVSNKPTVRAALADARRGRLGARK